MCQMGPTAIPGEYAAEMQSRRTNRYQWREIGETEWMPCSKSWFDYCRKSPLHDTKESNA